VFLQMCDLGGRAHTLLLKMTKGLQE